MVTMTRERASPRYATKTTRWLWKVKMEVGRETTVNDKMHLKQILSGGETIKMERDCKYKTRRDKWCSQKKSRTIWKSDRHYSSSSQLSLRHGFLAFLLHPRAFQRHFPAASVPQERRFRSFDEWMVHNWGWFESQSSFWFLYFKNNLSRGPYSLFI